MLELGGSIFDDILYGRTPVPVVSKPVVPQRGSDEVIPSPEYELRNDEQVLRDVLGFLANGKPLFGTRVAGMTAQIWVPGQREDGEPFQSQLLAIEQAQRSSEIMLYQRGRDGNPHKKKQRVYTQEPFQLIDGCVFPRQAHVITAGIGYFEGDSTPCLLGRVYGTNDLATAGTFINNPGELPSLLHALPGTAVHPADHVAFVLRRQFATTEYGFIIGDNQPSTMKTINVGDLNEPGLRQRRKGEVAKHLDTAILQKISRK